MGGGLKLSSVILLLIFFMSQVSAYDSFFIIKEDIDSSKALLIYDIDPTPIMNKYDTILSLTRTDGDFSDLVRYLKNSKILNVVYYSNDDINNEIIQTIKIEAGVSFRKLNGKDVTKLNVTQVENLPGNQETSKIITGEAISNQNTNTSRFLLIFSVVLILIVIIVSVVLISNKKENLKTSKK